MMNVVLDWYTNLHAVTKVGHGSSLEPEIRTFHFRFLKPVFESSYKVEKHVIQAYFIGNQELGEVISFPVFHPCQLFMYNFIAYSLLCYGLSSILWLSIQSLIFNQVRS